MNVTTVIHWKINLINRNNNLCDYFNDKIII